MDADRAETYRTKLLEAARTIERLNARVGELERGVREPIAVVGMGLRMPQHAQTPDDFWSLLREGTDATREFPGSRGDARALYHPDPDHPGTAYVIRGGFLERVDEFDPATFGIAPREAVGMDPQQRLTLEVAWEALERAGYAPTDLEGSRTGVYLGVSTTDYVRMRQQSGSVDDIDAYQLIGEPSFIAGRVSYTFGLRGPSAVIDTTCSSSLVAVHQAAQALRGGECDMALAGGVSLMLSPYGFVMMSKFRALAADGRCKTFDAAADGYARGEGAGIVVLKRLSDALADKDTVLAVVRGSAVNHDGRSSGLTVPNPQAQQDVIRRALGQARIPGSDVDYVEAHGTGTSLGDPIELRALDAVTGEGRDAAEPLLVGSVKTNIGHLEPAAGIAGLIKVILAMEHGEVPPHLNLATPNPQIPWRRLRMDVPTAVRPWPERSGRRSGGRVAGISGFGASGTNAHIVVSTPDPAPDGDRGDAPEEGAEEHLLLLSARTRPALHELAARYADELSTGRHRVGDVCFTSQTGRARFAHGLALTGRDRTELVDRLAAHLGGEAHPHVAEVEQTAHGNRRTAWLLTGQGAQYAGMAAGLRREPAFAEPFAECCRLLDPLLDRPVAEIMWSDPADPAVHDTRYTQPALFAVQYALGRMLLSWGQRPAALLGHSIGEISAACLAGAIDLPDAARLVAGRGAMMAGLPPGGLMVAVSCDEATALAAIAGHQDRMALAAVNGPHDVVLSGAADEVREAAGKLAAAGFRTRELTVSHAFHSPLLRPIADDFEKLLASITVRAPQIPVVSNVDGRLWTADQLQPRYWLRHALGTVRFADGLGQLLELGVKTFVEVGPQPVLTGLGRKAVDDTDCFWTGLLRQSEDDRATLLSALGRLHLRGCTVDWPRVHASHDVRRVPGPTYPWQRERYWFRQDDRPLGAVGGPRPETEPVPADPSQPASDENLVHALTWVQAPGTPARPAGAERVLLIGTDPLLPRLAGELTRRGAQCEVVPPTGDTWEQRLDTTAADPVTRVVVSGLGHSGTGPYPPEAGELLLRLARRFEAGAGADEPARLVVLTRGAVAAGSRQRVPDIPAAGLWGLGRTIAAEQPGVWGAAVDLDPEGDDDLAAVAQAVLDGAGHPAGEDQWALRGRRRFVARLRPVPPQTLPVTRGRPHRPGTVLVTGGPDAVTMATAEWLIRTGTERLVLAAGPDSTWDEAVRHLAQKGAAVETPRLDTTDSVAVSALVDGLTGGPSPLRGVVVAGGPGPDEERAPAVARLLHEHTRTVDLDFFTCFSSAAGAVGSPGQAGAATTHASLEALAHHRLALGLPALTVGWSSWDDPAGSPPPGPRPADEDGTPLPAPLPALLPAGVLPLLGRLLRADSPQFVVCAADRLAVDPTRPVFRDLALGGAAEPPGTAGQRVLGALAAHRGDDEQAAAARRRVLEEYMGTVVAGVLDMGSAGRVSADTDVFSLGMDSLMVMEAVLRCREELDLTLRPGEFFTRTTVSGWTDLVEQVMRGQESAAGGGRPEETDEWEAQEDPYISAAAIAPRAVLAPDVRPPSSPPAVAVGPAADTVLLTGATGFVGAFLLEELLSSTSSEVVCLVRCTEPALGLVRLRETAAAYGLPWRADADRRITVLPGDLGQPRLGLTGPQYDRLATGVGAIYHNGALVNFVRSFDQLAAPNIAGTEEILRLAVTGTAKAVNHVSTYAMWGLPEGDRVRILDTDDIDTAGRLVNAYVQTKWGAEHLVRQARKRGVPVRTFRLGRVLGDTRTGAALTTHFVCRVIKGCIQLGLAPELDFEIEMTPVDYVASALVRIAGDAAPDGTFHLVNPQRMPFSGLVSYIRRRGWPLRVVDRQEWWQELRRSFGIERNELHLVMDTVRDFIVGGERAIDYDVASTERALSGSGISCPPLDDRLLDTYFDYFLRSGYLSEDLQERTGRPRTGR